MRLVKPHEPFQPAPPAPPNPGAHLPPRSRRYGVAVLAGLALVAVGTAADYAVRARMPRPPLVALAPITKGPIAGTVRASGTVAPVEVTSVSQPIAGRISDLLVSVGDRVERDQVIARFDPLALRAELARAEARLVAAEAAAFEAEVSLSRVTRAGSPGPEYRGPFTEKDAADLDDVQAVAMARAASAAAQVEAREADYRVARRKLGQRVVRSPLGGVVIAVEVSRGQSVVEGVPLVKIATALDRLVVEAPLPEAEVARVKPGQLARFDVPAHPGRTFEARVTHTGALRATEAGKTFPVTVAVENGDGALRPGMTAALAIETRTEGGVFRVPVAALAFRPRQWGTASEEPAVWIADAESGRLSRVSVEVGLADGNQAEVRSPALVEGAAVAVAYASVPSADVR